MLQRLPERLLQALCRSSLKVRCSAAVLSATSLRAGDEDCESTDATEFVEE